MKSRISDETRIKQGRGKGSHEKYEAFLKVRDFPSKATCSRPGGQLIDRKYEILSGIELSFFSIFDFALEELDDLQEQFPLPLEVTVPIAERLNIRHIANEKGKPWIVTVDFLLTFKDPTKKKVAVSVKSFADLIKRRTIEKLQVECSGSEELNYDWVLLTDRELDDTLMDNLQLFREKYFLDLHHFEEVCELLKTVDWNSSILVSDVIREVAKKCGLTFAHTRLIFTQLIAKKRICLDYTKDFTMDMNIYEFTPCL